MNKLPTKNPDKSITITLSTRFARALRHFKQEDPRHLSVAEQVRRALICYWVQQPFPAGAEATEIAIPSYQSEDEEFQIVTDPEPEQ